MEPFKSEDVLYRFVPTEEERKRNKHMPYEYVISGPAKDHKLWGWYGGHFGWQLIVTSWQWFPIIARLLSDLTALRQKKGCPCHYVLPCSPACSCANPVLSGGCQRCCRYGSHEQRQAAARRLTTLDGDAEMFRAGMVIIKAQKQQAEAERDELRRELVKERKVYAERLTEMDRIVTSAMRKQKRVEAKRDIYQAALETYANMKNENGYDRARTALADGEKIREA